MLIRRVSILVLFLENEWLSHFVIVEVIRAIVGACLDALLAVVPGAARVGEAECNLDAGDDNTSQETIDSVLAK